VSHSHLICRKVDVRGTGPFDLDRFSRCVKELFGVNTEAFVSTDRRGAGYFRGYDERGNPINIATDNRLKTTEAFRREGPSHKMVAGRTYSELPFLNFIARDLAENRRISSSYLIAAQVHETGNSLGFITGRRPQPKFNYADRDDDPGRALEECVYKGRVAPDGRVSIP
jgi:hypothetical protein